MAAACPVPANKAIVGGNVFTHDAIRSADEGLRRLQIVPESVWSRALRKVRKKSFGKRA